MKGTFQNRAAMFAIALSLGVALVGAHALAALDLVVGARGVIPNTPITDCDTRAKAALASQLQGVFEAGTGTHQWIANSAPDNRGNYSAAAVIHCFPTSNGYSYTITCSAQVPPNPQTATDLCAKIGAAFAPAGGQ